MSRMESVLDAPVKIEAAQPADIDPQVLWERMDAHGWSQNETARRAGISTGHLSQVMNGQRIPVGGRAAAAARGAVRAVCRRNWWRPSK